MTAEHPFMTTQGWKSIDPELTFKENPNLKVSTLQIGDVLVTKNSEVEIWSIAPMASFPDTTVYNPLLDGNHTYYADEYLVHNKYSCFTPETLVTLHNGEKRRIDEVVIGDRVLGENGEINTVLGIETPQLGERKLYGFNGDKAFVTAEHPFMTTEGWKSIDPELTFLENPNLKVSTLQIGDVLVTEEKEVLIYSINSEVSDKNSIVYNLVLDGNNTYYADGYLVHNKGSTGGTSSGGRGGSPDGGGGGGGGGGSTQVFVLPPPAPTPVINLTQSIINLGNSTTIIWSASGANSCSGVGFFTGGATSGEVEVTPTETTTYTIICTWSGNYRSGGQSSSSGTVTVLDPILTISATPSRLQSGSTSIIEWTATNINTCSVSEDNPNIADSWSGVSGTQTTSIISEETVYTLTCLNDAGSVNESVTVRLVPVFQEF